MIKLGDRHNFIVIQKIFMLRQYKNTSKFQNLYGRYQKGRDDGKYFLAIILAGYKIVTDQISQELD